MAGGLDLVVDGWWHPGRVEEIRVRGEGRAAHFGQREDTDVQAGLLPSLNSLDRGFRLSVISEELEDIIILARQCIQG